MPAQLMSNTPKPTHEDASGSPLMKAKTLRLPPWKIAELLISKRGEQLVKAVDATDEEFQAWVEFNGIPIDAGEVEGWNFDDRCMVINYVFAQGCALEFADGSILPKNSSANENNSLVDDKPASEVQ